MTSKYSAKIEIFAKEKTKSVFDSIQTDNRFSSETPTKTRIFFNKKIIILIDAQEISHLRANLNSTLRLAQTSNDSIESVKI